LGFAEENCGVAASVFSRKLIYFEKILKYFFITFLPFFCTVFRISDSKDFKSIWRCIYLQGFAKAIAS